MSNALKLLPKKAVADTVSVVTVSPDTPNVLQEMIQLRQTKTRTDATNKVALEEEKEMDTTEKVVEELKRQLQPKRVHTHDDAGDAHEMLTEVDNWDLSVQGGVYTTVTATSWCQRILMFPRLRWQ